ncbi:cytochrome P450 [Aspergillus lucknowensis]|uniref:Cytochrome P450 n=1 Tax=Aspergillus lucknowensis TaxID=176173 RepID=A0ABR4LWI0_9EURO
MASTDIITFLWAWKWLAIGLIATYWVLWIAYARTLHPYAKYPGPFLASISRFWIVNEIFRGRAHKTQAELHRKYGPIIRIAPNEVGISDPASIKEIYSINSGFTKTDFYAPWRASFARFPDHFTSTDEKTHGQRRKIVNNIYSMSNIVKSEPLINICTGLFMTRMDEFAERRQLVDLATWVQWYAFDVIGELYFSSMFGFMKQCSDVNDYIASLDTLLPVLCAASVMPTYIRAPFLASGVLLGSVRKARKALGSIEQASANCVRERLQSEAKSEGAREDILGKLLDIHTNKGDQHNFNLTDVQVEVYTGLFAGSDTTAAALSSILYHLLANPDVCAKLRNEIDEASTAGKLSYPHITYAEAMQLPYLMACCKEGMRMHPSVGLTLPRTAPPGGCQIAGQWFPGGLRVGVNAAVVHFDESIFGSDAKEYNPDRWFREDAVNMDRHMFQFGGGSRTCIGKNISLCEIHKLVPEILRSYDLELASPENGFRTMNHWFNKPLPLNVHIRKRKPSGSG